ncbi:MAG: biotin/lipoyl-binding protein, partial [Gemmatimonadetes bacterium]|nr:biotin/lipoyl-binding protein [Gemmatimonadota bacterium]
MKNLTIGRAATAAAALLVLAGCGKKDADAATPARGGDAITLGPENIAVVQTEEIRTGPQLSGNLSAEREAQVRAQISGQVMQVYADQGQTVRQGQALARIDATALTDAATSARTGVSSAQTSLEVARRNYER